jgi:hypothetical protein
MIRMQIQLTEEQRERLGAWAGRLGISLAEAVRRCVEDRLSAERLEVEPGQLVRDALAVAGRFADPAGGGRVARDHDAELAEAFRS